MFLNKKELSSAMRNKHFLILICICQFAIALGCGQRVCNQQEILGWNIRSELHCDAVFASVRKRLGDKRTVESMTVQAEEFLGPQLSMTNTKDTFTLVLSIVFDPTEISVATVKDMFSLGKCYMDGGIEMFKIATPKAASVYLLEHDPIRRHIPTDFDVTAAFDPPAPFCCIDIVSEQLAIAIVKFTVNTRRDVIHEDDLVNIELTYPVLGNQLYDRPTPLRSLLDLIYVNNGPVGVRNCSFRCK